MSPATAPAPHLAAQELADRLAAGESMTVLDLRDAPEWGVSGPGVTTRNLAVGEVLSDPAAVAATLRGPVAVVCSRGRSAGPVAHALRAQGVQALVLEEGMLGWIGALQARTVTLGVGGAAVIQVQRPGRGCLSYILASGGQALVVDPAPRADVYLELAQELDATITQVFDTHLHADHLSGARALAQASGAALRLPAATLARGIAFGEEAIPVQDGEALGPGELEVRAIALPGHTTDMTGLLIAGRALIGGDSLFAGGVARPDLQQRDPEGALRMGRMLHATLRERVMTLGDDVLLLPGHTHPGVLSDAVAPTLAEVRAAVPELAIEDPSAFAERLLANMPPRPANFEAIIAVNAGRAAFDAELESGGNSCAASARG